ncbi:hypothetical protein Tco_1404295 [Tanacetum coccineum]
MWRCFLYLVRGLESLLHLYSVRKFATENQKLTALDSHMVLPDNYLFEILDALRLGKPKKHIVCICFKAMAYSLLSMIHKDEIGQTSDEKSTTNDDGHLSRSLEGKKATDVRLAAIAVGAVSRGGLGKLSVRGNNVTRGVTNFGLKAIARGCPSLTDLSLWKQSSISDEE